MIDCFLLFLAFDFCRFCVVICFFFIPATTVNDLRIRKIFYPRFYPLHLFSSLNSWERASIFPFECSGTTGSIFITSLVWRGPWLGIEPGTSRSRSQHSTTRLSRRRLCDWWPIAIERLLVDTLIDCIVLLNVWVYLTSKKCI